MTTPHQRLADAAKAVLRDYSCLAELPNSDDPIYHSIKELDDAVRALSAPPVSEQAEGREVPANALYRGNSVAHWHNKAKAYGDMVHGINPILGVAEDEKTCDAARRVVAEIDAQASRIAVLESEAALLERCIRSIDDSTHKGSLRGFIHEVLGLLDRSRKALSGAAQ